MDTFSNYSLLISAIGSLTLILLVQLVIADAVGIASKHIPGTTVKSDHSNLLFRATRVVANSNESLAIFILASAFCVLSGASAYATGIAAWVYVGARLVYAICYYTNLQTLRSIIFGVSVLALIALLVIGVWY